MFRARCTQKKKDPRTTDKFEAHFNVELLDDVSHVFMDMHSIFFTYYMGSQSMTKFVYEPHPKLGLWDPYANYEELTALEKHRQDRRILLELLPDIIILGTSDPKIPSLGEDELLRGSRNFIPRGPKKYPTEHLWMLLSLRLFCDIHHILGPNISKPFEVIRKLGSEANGAISECLKQRDAGKVAAWPVEADESIKKNFSDRVQQSLFVDEAKEYIDYHARNVKWWRGKKDFELLRRHPWACGLMDFNIHICMEEFGLLALDATDFGVTATHFYNALQKEGILRTSWPDLELFMTLLGNDRVFRGDRPATLEDCSTRLSVVRGLSAQTFANNRRDRGMLLAKHGRRRLMRTTGLVNILKVRHVSIEQHPFIVDEESATILAALEEVLNKQVSLTSNDTHVVARNRNNDKKGGSSKLNDSRKRKYNPVELLMSLQFGFAREIPSITFDYLAFHKSCSDMLNIVYGVFGPLIETGMPPVWDMFEQYDDSLRLTMTTDILLSLAIPLSKAKKMIRKVAMPVFPPTDHEYQQIFNQRAILIDVADAIANRIANGRMKIQANVKARKQVEARPEVIYFETPAVSTEHGHHTFMNGKMWQHKHPDCTKTHCLCGARPVPMLKPGWRQALSENAQKFLAGKL